MFAAGRFTGRRVCLAVFLFAVMCGFEGAAFSQTDGDESSYVRVNVETLRLAIEDMVETFGDDYAGGEEYLSLLKKVEWE